MPVNSDLLQVHVNVDQLPSPAVGEWMNNIIVEYTRETLHTCAFVAETDRVLMAGKFASLHTDKLTFHLYGNVWRNSYKLRARAWIIVCFAISWLVLVGPFYGYATR